jgi:hypothetical protein
MGIIFTLPLNIEFEAWTHKLAGDQPKFSFPVNADVKDWWEWAEQVILSNNLSKVPNPSKLAFPNEDDWKTWAKFFCDILSTEDG